MIAPKKEGNRNLNRKKTASHISGEMPRAILQEKNPFCPHAGKRTRDPPKKKIGPRPPRKGDSH